MQGDARLAGLTWVLTLSHWSARSAADALCFVPQVPLRAHAVQPPAVRCAHRCPGHRPAHAGEVEPKQAGWLVFGVGKWLLVVWVGFAGQACRRASRQAARAVQPCAPCVACCSSGHAISDLHALFPLLLFHFRSGGWTWPTVRRWCWTDTTWSSMTAALATCRPLTSDGEQGVRCAWGWLGWLGLGAVTLLSADSSTTCGCAAKCPKPDLGPSLC